MKPGNIEIARQFAAMAHRDQCRKYSGQPYIVHCLAVARTVAGITHDEEVVIAALLHDTVERTPVTLAELERAFGANVAGLVDQVSSVARRDEGTRTLRRQLNRRHYAEASRDAKTIKLADLLDSTAEIAETNPTVAPAYLREKQELLPALADGNLDLYRRVEYQIEHGLRSLGAPEHLPRAV